MKPADAEMWVSQALRDHAEELQRFVRARLPPSEVDDVLQTAALRALERAPTLQDPDRVRAWLFTLHRHLSTDVLRERARQERVAEALETQEPGAVPMAEICDCSTVQAKRLRPTYADVLSLVDTGGATLAEAADVLGITVNNATVRLHRARKALRQAMVEHCGVQSARDCVDCRCVDDGCCVA